MLPEKHKVVAVVVGYVFLDLTPLPFVLKVKVVFGCTERPEKHCFHVFYTLYLPLLISSKFIQVIALFLYEDKRPLQ